MFRLSSALLCCATSAFGQGRPSPAMTPQELSDVALPKIAVWVVALDATGGAAAPQLAAAAERAVAASGRFRLSPLADALDPGAIRSREAKRAEGDAEFKVGMKAYEDLDTQAALGHFVKAVKAYEQVDLTRAMKELSRAWVMRIACLVANGEHKAAEVEMERLLAVDAHAVFSPNFFSPDAVATAEKVRRQMTAGTARMEIRSAPSGAQVSLDGQWAGVTPLTVAGLAPGEHFISAALTPYARIQVKARPGAVDLAFVKAAEGGRYDAAVAAVRADPFGPGRDQAAVSLGRALELDQVLLVLARRGVTNTKVETWAVRLETRDGHNAGYGVLAPLPLDAANGPAATAAFAKVLEQDEPRRAGPVSHFASGLKLPGPGVSLTVGGAVLVVVGTVFALVANHRHDVFEGTPQNNPASPWLASSGKTLGVVADVGLISGVLMAGGGVALTLLDRKAAPAKAEPAPTPAPAKAAPSAHSAPTSSPSPPPSRAAPSKPSGHTKEEDLKNY